MKTTRCMISLRISAMTAAILLLFLLVPLSAQHESPATAEAVDGSRGAKVDYVDKAPAAPSSDLITVTSYPMTALAGVLLEDMSSGTTELLGPNLDDTASAVTNIGFDFWFDGVRATEFSCNPNGLCRLGPVVVTTTFTNSLATTTAAPKIAPFWDDLCTGANGKVHYKVTGSPGSRKLIVEWLNMKITRNGNCTAPVPANGSFQMWLFETTGVIQFVYPAIAATTADGGYSVGLQSGVATNIASVTTVDGTVSYAAANNAQMTAIASGTSYVFTPAIPAAPTGLNFTGVSAVGLTLNWTDNASNEVGYVIYRSTDGVNYSLLTQTAANANSFADAPLAPSTNYFYRVAAVSEGGLSSVLSGSQMTNALGNIMSTLAGGNWSSTSTWVGGVVPGASDQATIVDGAVVTIDVDASAYNVTVGTSGALAKEGNEGVGSQAILQFETLTGRTLTVGNDVLVRGSGVFRSGTSGTVTTHAVSISGDLTNNGILDFSTSGDTAGAGITFAGANNGVFGGTGATTDIRTITVNKGTSRTSVIEVMPTTFTVQGVTADNAASGYLTITNGTFKLSGSFTANLRTFATAAYTIPATGGFWLNNPNYTVTGQNGSPTNNGLLRMSQGMFNVGNSSGNSMGGGAGAEFDIDGGTLNTAGRLQTTSAVTYDQSGGTVNVCTVGQTATTACFGLTSTTTVFNMSGGTINLVQINSNATATTRRDYQMAGIATVTGGVLNVGTGATTGNAGDFEFRITGTAPTTVIDNTSNAKSLGLAGTTTFMGNITIPTGSTLNLHNGTTAQTLQFRGSTITNNGTINGGVAVASRLNFLGVDGAGGGPQSYGGSGVWGTMATPTSGFGILGQTTINAPIITGRVNLFGGQMINSNMITLGVGGASATVVQTSQAGSLINGGTFDVAPVFNTGTGGHTALYAQQPSVRVTDNELPPSRTIAALTVLTTNGLNIAGGNLTVTGTMTLTDGIVGTGSNTLTHNGTAARTNGYVNGTLNRSFTATGTYTYHVGVGGYSPMLANVTTLTTNPSTLSVKPTDDFLPGLAQATAVSRYWTLNETGDLTADLTFTYLQADANGTETNYKVWRRSGGVTSEVMPSVINDTNNTAMVTGITAFSDWGIGEALAPTVPFASIDGTVTNSNGDGIPQTIVVLSNSGGTVQTTLTNGFGNYEFDNIATGVTYTVTVSRKGYVFTPPSQMFTLTGDIGGINFTGAASRPAPVTGKVPGND